MSQHHSSSIKALEIATKLRNNIAKLMQIINATAVAMVNKGVMSKFSDTNTDGTFTVIALTVEQIDAMNERIKAIEKCITAESQAADVAALLAKPEHRLVLPMGIIGSLDTAVTLIKPEVLTERFIEITHSHWDAIIAKDDTYFIKNFTDIFKMNQGDSKALAMKLLPYLYTVVKLMFKADLVDTATKRLIWDCLRAMLRLSVGYTHHAREPVLVAGKPSHRRTVAGTPEGGHVPGAVLGDDLGKWANLLQVDLVYS